LKPCPSPPPKKQTNKGFGFWASPKFWRRKKLKKRRRRKTTTTTRSAFFSNFPIMNKRRRQN
jgi:hypothetical protein